MRTMTTAAGALCALAMACGGGSSSSTTPAATPTNTTDPAATPEPEPMIAPEPEPANAHPLAGAWRGATDTGPLYVTLESAAADAPLSGQACKAAGEACTALSKLAYADGVLTFQYAWQEAGKDQTATGRLQIQADGRTLDGGVHMTTCSCTKPVRLVRVP